MGAQGKIGRVSHPDADEPEQANPAAGQQPPPSGLPSHPGPRYQQPYPAQPYGQPPHAGPSLANQGYGNQGYGQQPYAGQPFPPPTSTPTAPLPVAPRPEQRPEQRPGAERSRVPRWLWPAVALLALLVGGVGGAVAGSAVSGGERTQITVQRRTAQPLPDDNTSVAAVASKVLPGTVQIVAEYDGKDNGATGSGFVYDGSGHVITNNHVVAQADKDKGPIQVIDQAGRHLPATVVGRSTVYDLAVLEVPKAKSLPRLSLGSAAQMRVGETVVAIGSPLGLSATVTSGIVSAVNRPVTTGEGANENSYINAVQTDAAINPGNSGGPLVNLQGQVVGVNSAIASLGSTMTSQQGGNIGVGFAIPVEQVQVTATQIIKTGTAQYPVIGANVSPLSSLDGARVDTVVAGTPAARSDLKQGDIIRKIDGKPVTSSIDLVVAIRSHVPGEKVRLLVQRGSRTQEVEVGLAAKTG
ncbi:MAG: peptidase and chymotrypsin/Hap [Marmoricola sp.]|nr:peptidase and chymotrypsin/Hap [Marmoricola sp.]